MSNFMFPVCKNINCGNKTEREIEIEKKLEIAITALEFYALPLNQLNPVYNIAQHHKTAEEALAKIKEVK